MNSESIVRTRCEACSGTGTSQDETLCPACQGTGLVAVSRQPTVPGTPPTVPTPSSTRRRRFSRYYTDLPLTLRDQQEREVAGHCVVIAEGGLAAVLPVGSVVTLRLHIPTHSTTLEVLAVLRNQLGLRHGFQFLSLTDAQREAVKRFCNGLMLQSEIELVDS